MEDIETAPCVVVELKGKIETKGPLVRETIWLDPALNYAPRRWERREDERLIVRRESTDFDEFAAGFWLPWKVRLGIGSPKWSDSPPESKACTIKINLRKARVAELPAEIFRP